MTPLGKIENGILKEDWKLVCEGFNKLTGKKLNPPIPPKAMKTPPAQFNPSKANKNQLYLWLKDKVELDPPIDYSVGELREMVAVQILNIEDNNINPHIPPSEVGGRYGLEPVVKRDNGYINPFKSGADVKLPDGGMFLDGFRYTSGKKKLMEIDTVKVVATLDPQLRNVGDPTNEYTPREAPKKGILTCLNKKCNKKFEGYVNVGVDVDGELKALCTVCAESI